MIFNAIDGTVFNAAAEFLDDADVPLVAAAGYPKVKLYDQNKALLSQTIGTPSTTPGLWNANVSIPDLGLDAKSELRLVWIFIDNTGTKTKSTDSVLVEPKTDYRETDVVTLWGDTMFPLVVPMHISAQDTALYQIYFNNTPVVPASSQNINGITAVTRLADKTSFYVPMIFPSASMQSALLKVDVVPIGGTMRSFTYKFWAVTPQIMLAMNFLEDFLNKSRIENVIPELQYTAGDLIGYLERGLYLFNNVGQISTWTGMNMQGVLFDGWLTCASYYALSAQLIAEGSLAFDFSGQGISLNVDRTPQLDSALGRIESAIQDKIVPLKKQLAAQGLRGGDGSIGSKNLNVPSSHGSLGLINAPTTHLPFGVPIFTGRRY